MGDSSRVIEWLVTLGILGILGILGVIHAMLFIHDVFFTMLSYCKLDYDTIITELV